MTVIATALRHLIAAGISGDDLVRAVEEMELAQRQCEPDNRSKTARRQAAYRDRKAAADVTPNVTEDVTDITERNALRQSRNGRNGAGSPQEKQKSQPPSQSPPKGSPLSHEQALAIWNEMAVRTGLPKALSATGKRQGQLRERLREHGDEGFRRAVAAVELSDFCRGKNERGWRADLGFLLRPDAFVKLLEGCYGPTEKQARPQRGWTIESLRSAIAFAEDNNDHDRAAELREKLAGMTSADPQVASVISRVSGSLSAISRENEVQSNAPW